MSDLQRQVLTAAEVGQVSGLAPTTVYDRVKKHGHILGVRPIPDTGKRVLFSRVLIERALHGESGPALPAKPAPSASPSPTTIPDVPDVPEGAG